MTSSPLSPSEQLSALADHPCQDVDLAPILAACAEDRELRARWRDYHLIADVLRGHRPAAHADEEAFLARLRPALQMTPARLQGAPEPAANEPRFGWPWLAAAACLALAVGALSVLQGALLDAPELAIGQRPVVVSSPGGPLVRDAALEELLQAHHQQGGASVLPMPSGFLRNATFDADLSTLAPQRPGR